MNPLGRRMKNIEGIPLVVGIWIFSILLSLPYALHHQVNFAQVLHNALKGTQMTPFLGRERLDARHRG